MAPILYAEDDFANRKLLEIQLTRSGYPCDTAENGEQALALIQKNSYKLVILDLNMPGKNGLDVIHELRAQGSSLPIFALTSDDSDIEALKRAGFNEVLIKPVLDNSLVELLKQYIS